MSYLQRMGARRPSTWWRVVFAAVVPLLAFGASPARAETLAPELDNEFDAIVQYNYRGGVTDPATAPACEATCEALWSAEQRPAAEGTPSALQREVAALREETGTLPKAWRLGEAAGRVSLAFSAFTAGFLIGDYANHKWLHVGIAQSPDATPGATEYYFTDNRAEPFSGAPSEVETGYGYPPDAVFYWHANVKYRSTGQCPPGTAPCETTITDPSNPFNIWPEVPEPFRARQRGADDQWHIGYLTVQDVLDGALTDYAGRPYDRHVSSPADPGVSAVGTATRGGLESGRFPNLTAKLEFELGTQGACDPVEPFVCNGPDANPTTRERERRCDLRDGGTGADPDPDRTTTANDPALYELHQPFLRRAEGADPADPLVDVPLRKGWTAPHPVKEWAGWGWRHIQAKHGWSADDIAATEGELQSSPVRQLNAALRYVGAEYDQNGERCARVVIVRDGTRSGEPMPAGIVTAYGELLS